MAKQRDIQTIGVTFGDWKLVPVDDRNWELCHRHVTADTAGARRAGTAGTTRWHRLGRYYSWNTVDAALGYAADVELKEGTAEGARDIHAALAEYREITGRMAAELAAALEGGAR